MGKYRPLNQERDEVSAAGAVEPLQPTVDGLPAGCNVGTLLCERHLLRLPPTEFPFLLGEDPEPFLQPGSPGLEFLQRHPVESK
jgi:hypothetical protein